MNKKILLVDDDQHTLDMLEMFLYKNYEIVTAHNGYEALTKAEKELPDLIMTDITMPEMDGIRFFNRIGKSDSLRRVPIVAVTTFGKGNTRNSLLNMGFFEVIPKPFEKNEIISTAAKAIESANGTEGERDEQVL